MEGIYQGVSPGGALGSLLNKQNFHYGAKALSSFHSSSSIAPPSKSAQEIDGWIGTSNSLGLEQFSSLSDEFIETDEFSPENLFPDLTLPSFDIDFSSTLDSLNDSSSVKTESYFIPIEDESCISLKSPITDSSSLSVIKLKKVKCEKNFNTDFGCISSLFDSNLFTFEPEEGDVEENYSKSSLDLPSHYTLKDVMDLNEADTIINSYLLPDASPTQENSTINEDDLISSHLLPDVSPSQDNSTINEDDLINWDSDNSSIVGSSNLSPLSSSIEHSDDEDQSLSRKPTQQKRRKLREKPTSEMRYLRKKEQNKIAARRYRMKKKAEEEQLINILSLEEQRHTTLTRKNASLKQEMSFIKKILREILVSKEAVPSGTF